MIQGQEACLYDLPGAFDYGRRGYLVNLDDLIAKDSSFENAWGSQIDQWRGWGTEQPRQPVGLAIPGG
jgi:hypothetical protein